MKFVRTTLSDLLVLLVLGSFSILFSGCGTLDGSDVGAPVTPRAAAADNSAATSTVFQVGDLVRVEFSGGADPLLPHDEHIKEDGTITLYLVGAVKAAGKTPGQLQNELQDLYVPKYYRHLNVTVRGADLFYYVGGEVRSPNREQYLGPITVTGAIKTAGDFTDFASRKKVQLIRANGTKYIINAVKAMENPEQDLPVYPGDRINVPRRFL